MPRSMVPFRGDKKQAKWALGFRSLPGQEIAAFEEDMSRDWASWLELARCDRLFTQSSLFSMTAAAAGNATHVRRSVVLPVRRSDEARSNQDWGGNRSRVDWLCTQPELWYRDLVAGGHFEPPRTRDQIACRFP